MQVSQANFSRPGAIDLSALRRPPAPAGGTAPVGGAPGAASAGAPYLLDVGEATFQTDVIERSLQHPVVVEFWSPRSPASNQLGAVLTALSTEYDGKFLLVRIDIDANPGLAQAVGVQTVPLVIGVLRGQVVPLFQGPLGEPEARQYLDQLMTVAVANGIAGRAQPVGGGAPAEAEPPVDERFVKAEDAVGTGDLEGAIAAYQEILAQEPANAEAKSGLARVQLVQRTQDVPAEVRTRAAENPADVEAQLRVADVDLVGGHVEDAFDRLIRTVEATTGDDRNKARLHLLELFEVVGADDERVVRARQRLMTALF
jgi:putative thioredoxin